jgi:hypothetical protein
MNEKLFRKKSLDRVSSPEQLNDYMKVSGPSVPIVIAAIIILLAAVCFWGVFGTVESKIPIKAYMGNDAAYCWVTADKARTITEGMTVRFENSAGSVQSVSSKPEKFDDMKSVTGSSNDLYLMGVSDEEALCRVTISVNGTPGEIKNGNIITEVIRPISFITN